MYASGVKVEMDNTQHHSEGGQSLVEYALLLALVALAVSTVLLALGPSLADVYRQAAEGLDTTAPGGSRIPDLVDDFLTLIRDFQAENGRWPRSWGDYRFTDLGLDPEDWAGPVEGIYWSPNGNRIGLANRPGDNLQVYVTNGEGNTIRLYDGWNIWCVADSGQCYYHTVAPGNEIDISTVTVVED